MLTIEQMEEIRYIQSMIDLERDWLSDEIMRRRSKQTDKEGRGEHQQGVGIK